MGWKDKEIRTSEFVTKTHFLCYKLLFCWWSSRWNNFFLLNKMLKHSLMYFYQYTRLNEKHGMSELMRVSRDNGLDSLRWGFSDLPLSYLILCCTRHDLLTTSQLHSMRIWKSLAANQTYFILWKTYFGMSRVSNNKF